MKKLFLLIIIASALSCSTQQNPGHKGFVCTEHGAHEQSDAKAFAACFGLQESDLANYNVYAKESSSVEKNNLDNELLRLKNNLADAMVSVIMTRMKQYFGDASLSYWTLQRTTMPVTYRFFVYEDKGKCSVKAYSVILKKDLEARSLLRYLPLEYKMNFLQLKDEEMNSVDPRDLKNPALEP